MSLQPVSGSTKIVPESNLYLDVAEEGSGLPGLSQFGVAGPDLKQLQNGYNYTATTHPRASSKDDDDKKKDDDKKSDDKKDDDRKSASSRPESSSKSSEPKTQEKSSAAKSSSEKDETVRISVRDEGHGEDRSRSVEINGRKYEVGSESHGGDGASVKVDGLVRERKENEGFHGQGERWRTETREYGVQSQHSDGGEFIEIPKDQLEEIEHKQEVDKDDAEKKKDN